MTRSSFRSGAEGCMEATSYTVQLLATVYLDATET